LLFEVLLHCKTTLHEESDRIRRIERAAGYL
jgi:hypothetical protein